MLRLDPAHPPLWRSPESLQFGLDAVSVLDDPQPWELRVVRALETGIPESALAQTAAALGAPDGGVAGLLRRLGRAVRTARAEPQRRAVLQLPDGSDAALAPALGAALRSEGFEVAESQVAESPLATAAVVLVAHGVVDLRRATAPMAADVVHVPIVFSTGSVEVGPTIAPGRTACLVCIAAHRRDADPAWPMLAAQLLGRVPAAVPAALAQEAGATAARLLIEAERHPLRVERSSVTLRSGRLHRGVRSHRPHPECRCRSLRGSATADDLAVLSPTRSTVLAVPA